MALLPPGNSPRPLWLLTQTDRHITQKTLANGAGHTFHTLIADLATLARNTATTTIAPNHPLTTRPPIQQKAFDLLGVTCRQ